MLKGLSAAWAIDSRLKNGPGHGSFQVVGPGPLEVLGRRRSGYVSLGKFGTQLCSLSHFGYTVPPKETE
jgi:hypothetical protein